jgi:HK97 family phage major capsid protein
MPTTYYDISRQTSNVALPADVSQEIWSNAVGESAFMQLARQIRIPGTGTTIQTITGEPSANWVAETNAKPVSAHTFGKKAITPYKLAVIEAFSTEFLRDKNALYDECVRRLPAALGKKFDSTIMGTTAPGSGFDVLGTGVTKQTILSASGHTVYSRFVDADAAISANDGILNAIALAPQGKSIVLGAEDSTGHPIFTAGVGSNTVGSILGADVAVNKGVYVAGAATGSVPATVGVAGDFTGVLWGSVEGVQMSVSDQATIVDGSSNTISLWQNNMVAVRFEIEVAFAVMDKSQLVLLTGAVPSA